MQNIGKLLMTVGVLLTFAGALLFLFERFGLRIGRLPGDVLIRRENFVFYFPITTGLIVSLLITLFIRLFKH